MFFFQLFRQFESWVIDGDHQKVEDALNGQDRQLFLNPVSVSEHIHIALENNDGRLLRLLLPHANENFFTKRRGPGNETDFQLTMEKFPDCLPWVLDRFYRQMELVLHHAMALKELHKFRDLWTEFLHIPEDTDLFEDLGRRAIKFHNNKFMVKYLDGRPTNSVCGYMAYQWAHQAVSSENDGMFKFLMPFMRAPYLPDLTVAVFQSNNPNFLFPFLRQWKEKNMVFLPKHVMWLCIDQVNSWTVREVLKTGFSFNTEVPNIHLCDFSKWKRFLNAGFCLNREERLMRLGPRQPMKQASKKKEHHAEREEPLFNPRGFPTLRLLATVKFRRILFQGGNITKRCSFRGDFDKVFEMMWLRHLPNNSVTLDLESVLTVEVLEEPTHNRREVSPQLKYLVQTCSYTREEVIHMMQDNTDAIYL